VERKRTSITAVTFCSKAHRIKTIIDLGQVKGRCVASFLNIGKGEQEAGHIGGAANTC